MEIRTQFKQQKKSAKRAFDPLSSSFLFRSLLMCFNKIALSPKDQHKTNKAKQKCVERICHWFNLSLKLINYDQSNQNAHPK
jgi:hypothetical protein